MAVAPCELSSACHSSGADTLGTRERRGRTPSSAGSSVSVDYTGIRKAHLCNAYVLVVEKQLSRVPFFFRVPIFFALLSRTTDQCPRISEGPDMIRGELRLARVSSILSRAGAPRAQISCTRCSEVPQFFCGGTQYVKSRRSFGVRLLFIVPDRMRPHEEGRGERARACRWLAGARSRRLTPAHRPPFQLVGYPVPHRSLCVLSVIGMHAAYPPRMFSRLPQTKSGRTSVATATAEFVNLPKGLSGWT